MVVGPMMMMGAEGRAVGPEVELAFCCGALMLLRAFLAPTNPSYPAKGAMEA